MRCLADSIVYTKMNSCVKDLDRGSCDGQVSELIAVGNDNRKLLCSILVNELQLFYDSFRADDWQCRTVQKASQVSRFRQTHVSEKDFMVFLCKLETAILAASCTDQYKVSVKQV